MGIPNRLTIKLTGGPHGIPRTVVHQVQRGRLLDAMADVVAEEGYQATTVHKVLRRAHISRRTYYELFRDKEDCFLAAYDEASEQALKLVAAACDKEDSPERRVESSLRTLLEYSASEPALARMCIVEVLAAGNAARARRAATMEQLAQMIAGALSESCIDDEEAQLRARILIGGIHELIYDRVASGRFDRLPDVAGEAVASYLSSPALAPSS